MGIFLMMVMIVMIVVMAAFQQGHIPGAVQNLLSSQQIGHKIFQSAAGEDDQVRMLQSPGLGHI